MTSRAMTSRAWILLGLFPLLLGGVWGALQLDATRQLLVRLSDPALPEAAAAPLAEALRPVAFDGPHADHPRIEVELVQVIAGVAQPTDVAPVPGHPGRVVVLGKQGTAWLASDGVDPAPWFSIDVATRSELGLLGIAFHPKFEENGLFFVDATPRRADGHATVIARWRTDPKTLASPRQEGVVLEVAQPYANHNAGQIAFGPDGMLYVGLGDGGYRGDPHDHGQDQTTLLGAMLRLDVDTAKPYAVPSDNPLVGVAGARPEIWARGLRNPWRFSFDPRGRLIVGDVGQDKLEEVDIVGRGDNLGWRVREGDTCYDPADCGSSAAGMVDPIWTYGRDAGISITGGVTWTAPGPLSGRWLVGDYGTGRLWALDLPDTVRPLVAAEVATLGRFSLSPSAFARMPDGTVWVADFQRGAVFRIAVP